MPRFVALLRGVNVGKGNRLPMAAFKAVLQRLDYTDVSTLLNSGNAVFSSTGRSSGKHAASIKSALEQTLDLRVAAVVKSAEELSAIVAANPITVPDSDHSKFFVAFAQEPSALQDLQELQPLALPPERLVVGDLAAYLHCAHGVLESKVGAAMSGKLGKLLTTRNWATVLKLHALCRASAA